MILALFLACRAPDEAAQPVGVPPVLPAAAAPTTAPAQPPDLVLVTIEGLRADAIGADHTPWMASLATQGLHFTAARAPSSWAVPSTVSVLTGLFPLQHGVQRSELSGGAVSNQPLLAESALTLAERLQPAGYLCQGVVNSPALGAAQGLRQGFDTLVELTEPDASGLRDALASLPAAGDQPRFLWIHVRDLGVDWDPRGSVETPTDALGLLRDRYRQEVSDIDAALGVALAGLETNTVLALAGTHGVELGEHTIVGHRSSLFDGAVRVPLILRAPGTQGTVSTPVSLVDLTPTLVQLATGKAPQPPEISGVSLVPALRGEALPERSLPLELRIDERHTLRGLVWGQHKLIRLDTPTEVRMITTFDLRADPEERAPDTNPASGRLASETLSVWLATAPKVE